MGLTGFKTSLFVSTELQPSLQDQGLRDANAYPGIPHRRRKKLIAKLDILFNSWIEHLAGIPDMRKYSMDFIKDGFYPFYTTQPIKILFIAREALGIEGSYIDILYDAYRCNSIAGRSVARYKFHRLLMKIAYGLIREITDWRDIPSAATINQTFATPDGISFAFMNVSKLNNSSGKWPSNWERIMKFVTASHSTKVNFQNEEIRILDPDLIITMTGGACLHYLGIGKPVYTGNNINAHLLKLGTKHVPLLQTFHFSAIRKRENEAFYLPIREILIRCFNWQDRRRNR